MSASWIKRSLAALGVVLVAVAAFLVLLPMVASNRLVRDRIALEMAAISGYEVAIAEAPEIRVWPGLSAELTGVTFSTPDGNAVLDVDAIQLDLSAIPALRGDVAINTAHLVHPTLHLADTAGDRPLPVPPRGGRIAEAIAQAGRVVAENRTAPDIGRFPSGPLGGMTFQDGRAVDASGEPLVTGVSGAVAWPALSGAGALRATGIFNGEDFSLEGSVANPLLLFGGAAVPLSVNLRAAPFNLAFDGVANLSDIYVDGRVSLSAPSLRRLLEWSEEEEEEETAMPANPVSIAGRLQGDARRMRLEDAELEFGGSPATGVLDLVTADDTPVVSGTLAFETLDLMAMLSTLQPFANAEARDGAAAGGTRPADIDIRVSAKRGTLGTVALENVAATARTDDAFSVFDLSDASAFGGSLQGGIRITPGEAGAETEFRLRATNVDSGAFGTAFGLGSVAPVGRGTVSLKLKAPGVLITPPGQAEGSFAASIGAGALSGLNLEALLARADKGGVFPLAEVGQGTTQTEGIEIKASIRNGVAVLDQMEIRTAGRQLALAGVVTLNGRGLALTGEIGPAGGAATGTDPTGQPPEAGFFVGGSWDAPYVSPAPSGMRREE